MSRPWLKVYGETIPPTIDPDRYRNVVELMLEACAEHAPRAAFAHLGSSISYQKMADLSRDFAAYLQNVVGIGKRDRVALMAPNMLAFPVAMFGILRTGAVQVNINPLYTARELKEQLNDADAETLVIFAGSTATLAEIIDETPVNTVIVLSLDDLVGAGVPSPPVDDRLVGAVSFGDALAAGAKLPLEAVDIAGEDLLFLQYTGGTTGLPRAAMLTHRNLVANILQYEAFAGDRIEHGAEVIVTAIPMYHIFALMVNTLSYFRFGATNVLVTNPRDMPAFVAEWAKWPVTTFTGVNTLFNGLLHTPGFADIDFSSLKVSLGGGAPVQQAVSERWKAVTGRHIREGYGLSETSPVVTLNPLHEDGFRGSIGIPMPSTDVSLRDDAGREVPAGEPGELCVRGPQVMAGYWRRPEATAEVTTADGYFRTGDVATMDEEGFFRIVDRKKDMVLVSGFNVFPNEVEGVVAGLPGVLESGCVGVPDADSGEAVKLFVVKTDATLSEHDVREHCRAFLAPYKVPKQIVFIDELPKSAVGKILRRELRRL